MYRQLHLYHFLVVVLVCCCSDQVSGELNPSQKPLSLDVFSAIKAEGKHDAPAVVVQQMTALLKEEVLTSRRLADIYVTRGAAFGQLAQYDAAIADYEAASRAWPTYVPAYLGKAQLLVRCSRYAEAISTLEHAREIQNTPELLGAESLLLLQIKKTSRAIKLLTNAMEQSPDDARFYFLMALAQEQNGDPEASRAMRARATELNALQGGAYSLEMDLAPARPAVPEADVNWSDEEIEQVFLQARQWQRQGEYGRALTCLDGVLKANENHLRARLVRARIRLETGDPAGALSDITLLLRVLPENNSLVVLRADARFSLNEYEKALQDYNTVLKRNPEHSNALVGKRKTEAALGR